MSRKLSLAEMMGTHAAASGAKGTLRLEQLGEILGDALPELPRNPVGRHRLIRSLQQRFGRNFRSLPGVGDLVKEFDSDIEMERKITRIQAIKYRPSKKE